MLFLLLLDVKSQVKRTATLCNVPVAQWLYVGDAVVPLRQARVALGTWAAANGKTSWASQRAAYHAAREMIKLLELGTSSQTARNLAVEALAKAAPRIATGQPFGDGELIDALVPAIAADPIGSLSGVEASRMLAQQYAHLLCARVRALTSLHGVPDVVYRFARAQLWHANAAWEHSQPTIVAQHPQLARLALPRTPASKANESCKDLVTSVGLFLLAADQQPPSPIAPTPPARSDRAG
jgi:hypothetical protein